MLAGGLARRMGGVDKTLLPLGRRTALDVLLARIASQCGPIAISANGDPNRFGSRCPVIADAPGPSLGPLAGVLAGLEHFSIGGQHSWLLTVPGDTPFVPLDLAERLRLMAEASGCAVARVSYAGRDHALVALWSTGLVDPLRAALHGRGLRKVRAFQAEVGVADMPWPDEAADPFFNINTPEDLAAAHARVAAPESDD